MKSKAQYVFTIDFDWLTDQVRIFWSEANYKKSYDVLKSCDIIGKQADDIIRGKLKMVQDPNGEKGCEGIVVEDNWKPNLNHCENGLYPDPNDIFDLAAKAIGLQRDWENDKIFHYKSLIGKLGELYQRENWEEAENIWDILDGLSPKIKELINYNDIPWSRKLLKSLKENNNDLQETIFQNNIFPSLDNYVKNQIELDKRPCPKSTKDYKKYNNG